DVAALGEVGREGVGHGGEPGLREPVDGDGGALHRGHTNHGVADLDVDPRRSPRRAGPTDRVGSLAVVGPVVVRSWSTSARSRSTEEGRWPIPLRRTPTGPRSRRRSPPTSTAARSTPIG